MKSRWKLFMLGYHFFYTFANKVIYIHILFTYIYINAQELDEYNNLSENQYYLLNV